MSLSRRAAHHASLLVSRHRRNPLVAGVARAARLYTQMWENRSYWFHDNGEAWLLERLAAAGLSTVFDVGANDGDWTAEVLAASSTAQVHAFEIVPTTAAGLRDRFGDEPRVTVVEKGLFDEPGSLTVNHYPEATYLSGSAAIGAHPFTHTTLDVPVIRGDDYCLERDIGRIDYLKVDAEGVDHKVLAGFDRHFKAGKVTAVQFEYGRANIAARYLLADHYDFFTAHGMRVGKLYPTYVEFRDYDPHRHEDFIGPNMVAVRADRPDLLAALGG